MHVTPEDQPVAVWIPSNCAVSVTAPNGAVLDLGELVQFYDVVAMDRKIREYDRNARLLKRALNRARRKLRGLERPYR